MPVAAAAAAAAPAGKAVPPKRLECERRLQREADEFWRFALTCDGRRGIRLRMTAQAWRTPDGSVVSAASVTKMLCGMGVRNVPLLVFPLRNSLVHHGKISASLSHSVQQHNMRH